jgi:hypothetical protein
MRLRVNSILNSITRRGTFLGNSAGVLGMFPPASILFVLHSAPILQLWGTTGSIRPLTRFGASMTHLEVWQLVLSQVLSSNLLVSYFLISLVRSCILSHRVSPLFPAGVRPALAAATVVSASAGAWSWVKTRV